jgi:hypothetical protein
LPARSPASASSIGATARHGPHHGAQKSTSTGIGLSSTSFFQLASVTVTGRRGNTFSLQRPHTGSSPRRDRRMRFIPPQWLHP